VSTARQPRQTPTWPPSPSTPTHGSPVAALWPVFADSPSTPSWSLPTRPASPTRPPSGSRPGKRNCIAPAHTGRHEGHYHPVKRTHGVWAIRRHQTPRPLRSPGPPILARPRHPAPHGHSTGTIWAKPLLPHIPGLTATSTLSEMNATIRRLPSKKAPGPDGIPYEVLRSLPRTTDPGSVHPALTSLCNILNHTLQTGTLLPNGDNYSSSQSPSRGPRGYYQLPGHRSYEHWPQCPSIPSRQPHAKISVGSSPTLFNK
jgi:hypothetical protein